MRKGVGLLGLVLLFSPACAKRRPAPIPAGAVIAWEVPGERKPESAPLTARAPAGSRVVMIVPGGALRLLSRGLARAAEPAVSPDGARVVFSAKASEDAEWQIWETALDGGAPRPLTSAREGATSPALLADGTLVFVSDGALFTLAKDADAPARLTFGSERASDPTVLSDGRVLFVAEQPNRRRTGLFAVNDDGTGVGAYAANHEGALFVARPREEKERVVFTSFETPCGPGRTESVLKARPWLSRGPFDLAAKATSAGAGWRGWSVVESAPLVPRPVARRRISTVDPAKKTGYLLCLDTDQTQEPEAGRAARVRILAGKERRALGEVAVAEDGSFFAEVPADLPLGVEALDAGGRVLRAVEPWFWVRPGETRGCIGCHEAHGRAPRNRRPLAVKAEAVKALAPGGAS